MPVVIPETTAPSEQRLSSLAAAVGSSLPNSYLAFVSLHDGARPESNSFAVGIENEANVSQFIAVAETLAVLSNVDGFPSGVIPLAEDDCGNFVYLEPQSGVVRFWGHELEGFGQKIASGLEEFLDSLSPFDSSSVQLQPGQVTKIWVNPSFKPEFD